MTLSVVIPASNEAPLLPACLRALLASEDPGGVEAVVVSNGSRDGTAEVARGHAAAFAARGWRLMVLELAEGGKIGALNAGDAATATFPRAYLDADVTVSRGLLAGLAAALAPDRPLYASGLCRITARGAFSRLYARAWRRVPFMATGVPGCGLFAVNAAGRARWGRWPAIVSDDTLARLHFAPLERVLVPEPYDWPVAEGFQALSRVRARQDRGVREVATLHPGLMANEAKPRPGAASLLRLAADPVASAAYLAVALAARLRPGQGWGRAR